MITFNSRAFEKQMKNVVNYSFGYLEGVQSGKREFLDGIGKDSIQLMMQFIDSNARVNPDMLHHVYEWNQTGSPSGRLFDINYTVSNLGLSFLSTFSQSTSVKNGSSVPFYDKARIMEEGIPVRIVPKLAQALAFEENGEMIFTKNPVTVRNPGGDYVAGSFERTIDEFILKYFKQSFLRASGLYDYIKKPKLYKTKDDFSI
jgi:hypothetical protein